MMVFQNGMNELDLIQVSSFLELFTLVVLHQRSFENQPTHLPLISGWLVFTSIPFGLFSPWFLIQHQHPWRNAVFCCVTDIVLLETPSGLAVTTAFLQYPRLAFFILPQHQFGVDQLDSISNNRLLLHMPLGAMFGLSCWYSSHSTFDWRFDVVYHLRTRTAKFAGCLEGRPWYLLTLSAPISDIIRCLDAFFFFSICWPFVFLIL